MFVGNAILFHCPLPARQHVSNKWFAHATKYAYCVRFVVLDSASAARVIMSVRVRTVATKRWVVEWWNSASGAECTGEAIVKSSRMMVQRRVIYRSKVLACMERVNMPQVVHRLQCQPSGPFIVCSSFDRGTLGPSGSEGRCSASIARLHACKRYHTYNCSASDEAKGEQEEPEGASLVGDDDYYMSAALEQAQRAYQDGEVPIGAVIVSPDGRIISEAYNTTEKDDDPTCHAEMNCIRNACHLLQGWRLLDCTLYVTLEPCPMCAGAILQARVGTLVYGAKNTLLGADGSWIRMLNSGALSEDVDTQGPPVHPFHPSLCIRRGVREGECAALMKDFFKSRRM